MEEEEEEEIIYNIIEGCPDWMLTMGDCMSLLMCFFVLLLTYTTPDEEKLMEIVGGIKGALSAVSFVRPQTKPSLYKENVEDGKDESVTDGAQEEVRIDNKDLSPAKLKKLKIFNVIKKETLQLKQLGFQKEITAEVLDKGIIIKLKEEELFDKGNGKNAVTINRVKAKKRLVPVCNILQSAKDNEIQISFNVGGKINGKRIFSSELSCSLERQKNLGEYLSSSDLGIKHNRITYHLANKPDDGVITLTLSELFDVSNVSIDELIKQ